MKAIANILGALVLTGLGIAMAHLTSGWIGGQWTIWGCTILVFIGIAGGCGSKPIAIHSLGSSRIRTAPG